MADLVDNLTLRMRAAGAAATRAAVSEVAGATKRLGTEAESAHKKGTLLSRTTHTMLKPFHHLKEETLGLAKSFAAAGLAFGTWEGIHKSIEQTDTLVKTTVKLHQQMGLSTEMASGLAGVMEARDIDPAALQMGLVTLSKALVQAEHGADRFQGAFRIVGMSARDVHEALNSPDGLEKAFEQITERMTNMEGGARKTALGQQLLGRASRGLAPLLQEGALGLQQQLKWAKEYGVTLDDHTIGSVEDMVAAQTEAQYAMLGLQIQLGKFAAPLVTKANLTLAQIVKSFRDGKPEGNHFARTVYQVGVDLKPVAHLLGVAGHYLKEHPALLRAAALGYVAYRLKLLKALTFVPLAYAKGLLVGRAFRAGFATGAGEVGAAQMVLPGLEAGLLGGGALKTLASIGWRMAKFGLGVGIASYLAQHVFHNSNMDPLSFLHPDSASGKKRADGTYQDEIPKAQRTRSAQERNYQSALAYERAHMKDLTAADVSAMSDRMKRDLGVSLAPNAAGGFAVIHTHVHLNDKEIATAVHKVAVKRKSTR
jgi:hypothetical protein